VASTDNEPPIEHQPERHRFAVVVEGYEAEITYRRQGKTLELVHTGVPEEIGGRGISGRLVATAVAFAASEGLSVRPSCPTARAWLEEHPEEAGTVTVEWGRR
jgi:uncharacterized protein